MPVYEVRKKDGSKLRVNAPKGSSNEEIFALANQLIKEEQPSARERTQELASFMATQPNIQTGRPLGPQRPGLLDYAGELPKGIGRGVVGLLDSAARGVATLAPEESEQKLRSSIGDLSEYLQSGMQPDAGLEDSIPAKFSEALGSFAGIAGLAIANPFLAAGTVGFAGAGEASERAREAGVDDRTRNISSLKGFGVGLSELIPLKFFKTLSPGEKIGIARRIGRAGVSGGAEGAQEAAAAIAQNYIEQGYNPQQDLFESSGEQATYGGAVGVFVQGLIDLATGGGRRRARTTQAQPATAPEDVQTEENIPKSVTEEIQNIMSMPDAKTTTVAGSPTATATEDIRAKGLTPEQVTPAETKAVPITEREGREAVSGIEPDVRERRVDVTTPDRQTTTVKQSKPIIKKVEETVPKEDTITEEGRDLVEDISENPQKIPAFFTGNLRRILTENGIKINKNEKPADAIKRLQEKLSATATEEVNAKPSPEEINKLETLVKNSVKSKLEEKKRQVEDDSRETDTKRDGVGPKVGTEDAGLQGRPATGDPKAVATPAPDGLATGVGDTTGVTRPDVEGVSTLKPDMRTATTTVDAVPEDVNYITSQYGEVLDAMGIPNDAKAEVDQKIEETESGLKFTRRKMSEIIKDTDADKRKNIAERERLAKKEKDEKDAVTQKQVDAMAKKLGIKTANVKTIEKILQKNKDLQTKLDEKFEKDERKLAGGDRGLVRAYYKAMKSRRAKDPSSTKDKETILELVSRPKEKVESSPIAKAQTYFRMSPNIGDSLEFIAFDIANANVKGDRKLEVRKEVDRASDQNVLKLPLKDRLDKEVQAYFKGTGYREAVLAKKWIDENLSKAVKENLQSKIDEIQATLKAKEADSVDFYANQALQGEVKVDETTQSYMDGLTITERSKLTKENKRKGVFDADLLKLENDSVSQMDMPLHPMVMNLLKSNQLQYALKVLANTTKNPLIARIASRFAGIVDPDIEIIIMEDTKLKEFIVSRNKTKVDLSKYGKIRGAYNAKEKTIRLAREGGANPHTLLHEVAHALTKQQLRKPGDPVTRQLNKLYKSVKGRLSSYYGSETIDEFVAEAFTNEQFRQELAMLEVPKANMTVLQKLQEIIGNFIRKIVGLPQIKSERIDALTKTDQLINGLLAPQGESRDAMDMLMASRFPETLRKKAENIYKEADKTILTKEYRKNFVSDVLDSFKFNVVFKSAEKIRYFLGFLPSLGVSDIAEGLGITDPYKMHRLMIKMEGLIGERLRQIDGLVEFIKNKIPDLKRMDIFNDLAFGASLAGVNPTLAYNQALGRYGEMKVDSATGKVTFDPNTDKMKDWRKFKNKYDALNSAEKEVYNEILKTNAKLFDELKKSAEGKIDNVPDEQLSKEEKKSIKQILFKKIFDKADIDPYIPFTRQGDYWLSFNAFDPETNTTERVVLAFETADQRRIVQQNLQEDSDVSDIQVFAKEQLSKGWEDPPSGSFMFEVDKILRSKNVTEETRNEILSLYIESLPESSFAKSFAKRKGTIGFQQDVIYALKTKLYDMSRNIERLKFSDAIRDEISRLEAQTKTGEGAKAEVIKELVVRGQHALNPPPDVLSRQANRVAFLFTLGFNISSAIVNLSQIPLMFVPYLGGKYGFTDSMRMIYRMGKLYSGSGFKTKILLPSGDKSVETMGFPNISNFFELNKKGDYVLTEKSKKELDTETKELLEELAPMVKAATEMGQNNRSIFFDTLGLDGTQRKESNWERFNVLSAGAFHQVERFNRQVALFASYKLELDRLNSDKAKPSEKALSLEEKQKLAADYSIKSTQMMNGGSLLVTAPRYAQSGVGRVALMYKGFGIQMYYTLFMMARQMAKNMFKGDPELSREAAKQLIGVMGSAFLLAGVQGMPFIGSYLLLQNMFFDDDELDAETRWRGTLGEPLWKGPLVALTGVDVSGRIGLSNLLFRSNPYRNEFSIESFLYETLGGPAGSTVKGFIDGNKDIQNGEFFRGVERMSPAFARNILQTGRFAQEGALTRRGDAIVDEFTFLELAGKLVGFSPARYTYANEVNRARKNLDRALNKKKSTLTKQLYKFTTAGDFEAVNEVRKKIVQFNLKHPDVAITPESIERSMKRHQRTTSEMQAGTYITPRNNAYINEMLKDMI